MWRCLLKKKVEKWKQQCVDSVALSDRSLQTYRGRRRLQMSCQPELSWRPPVAGLCHSETANKWSQSHGMRLTSNRVVFRWDSTPPEPRVLVLSLRTRREAKYTFRVSKTVERGGQRTEAHANIRCFTLYRWETESKPNLLLLFGGDSSSLTFRLLQLL